MKDSPQVEQSSTEKSLFSSKALLWVPVSGEEKQVQGFRPFLKLSLFFSKLHFLSVSLSLCPTRLTFLAYDNAEQRIG